MYKQSTGFFKNVFRGFSLSEKIALTIVGALVLFVAVQPVFVSASPDSLFSDNFDVVPALMTLPNVILQPKDTIRFIFHIQ